MISIRIASFLTITFFIITPLLFAEDKLSSDPQPIKEEQLRVISNQEARTLTTLPIHPKAEQISGHTLKQGGFEIKTQVFNINEKYKKVFKYYKKKMGKNSEFEEKKDSNGKQAAHFFQLGGSQSRNVIIEEEGKKATRVTFTIFEGGGGGAIEE